MVRSSSRISPTHYQILQVHPAAPLELITAAYWRLVSLALSEGNSGKASEIAVYHLTRSYQVLASATARTEYDHSLGIATAPLRPQLPRRGISPWMPALWEAEPEDRFAGVDYYSFLRVDPLANPAIISEAYTVMRNCYLRMVEQMQVRPELISQFEEAYRVLSDPERRRVYDQARRRQRRLTALNNAARKSSTQKSPAQTPDAQKPQGEASPIRKSQKQNGKRRAQRASNANGSAVGVAGVAPAAAKTPAAPKKLSPRPTTVGPASPDKSSRNGSGVEPPQIPGEETPGIQFKEVVRSLAAGSAAVLRRGGIGSISLAKKASQTLRGALLDVEPLAQDGMTPDEEQVLLDRLSAVPGSSPPAETAPPASDSGLLARLTLIGGPGFGTAFDVSAVPFTLGEDEGCDIALPGLAAEQARLLHRNGQFVLYSLTDEPKTSIHGDSIAWAVLQDGDSFEMGPYRLRFDAATVSAANKA
jgi:curved DNA-binding protein CbpA